MKKKLILHVITTLERGGAQRTLWNLIDSSNQNFDHIIICLSSQASYTKDFIKKNIKVFHLKGNNILETPIVFLKFIKILKKIKPDIIQSWLYHSDLLVCLSKIIFKKKIPIIWSIHHASKTLNGESFHTKICLRFLVALSYIIPDFIIYCSKISQQVHHNFGYKKNNSKIIFNSVNDAQFFDSNKLRQKCRNDLFLNEKDFLIGLIARNDPNKGIDVFFEMANYLALKNPEFKFLACGENIIEKELQILRKLTNLEVNKNLFLFGEVESTQEILNSLDLLICPSRYESFGLVALESIFCNTPVLGSNIDAFKNFLVNPFIVSKFNSMSFAKSVLNLYHGGYFYNDKTFRNLKLQITGKYSIKNMQEEYYKIYKIILEYKN